MKSLFRLLALAAFLSSLPASANGHRDPDRPLGLLEVDRNDVRTETSPAITWKIIYPATIPDSIVPDPNGGVTTREDLRRKIRVAGVSTQSATQELPAAFSAAARRGTPRSSDRAT